MLKYFVDHLIENNSKILEKLKGKAIATMSALGVEQIARSSDYVLI